MLFLFPQLFNGDFSAFIDHIFFIISFFIVCLGLYTLIKIKAHQYTSQKEYLSSANEYTDSDIIKA